MKKITLLLMFMSTFWTYAQVSSYSFSQTTGAYTEISGTPLGDATTPSGRRFVDPAVPLGSSVSKGPGFDIGFNFTFNGLVYNRFGVASNGWISLGQSALQVGSTTAVDMSSDSAQSPMDTKGLTAIPNDLVARISALGGALQAQAGASLSYATSGTAPNRVLVIQWKNYSKSSTAGDSFNFQIQLYETTNVVSIVYGGFTANTTAAKFQIGLRAAPLTTLSNFVNRISTTGWSATTQGLSASDAVSVSNLLTPSNGLTFSWTPSVCGGPTGFVATAIGANGATLNWNSNLPASAGYEYVVSTALAFPTVAGTAVTAATAPVTALSPSTVYNVFLRSNCGTAYTPWTFAGTFKTKCADGTSISENFDSYAAGSSSNPILPTCWESPGNVYVSTINPVSGTKALLLKATAATAYAILPPVSNLGATTYRLKFKATSSAAGNILDVGYFSNPDDLNTFTLLSSKTLDLPTTLALPAEFIVTPPALSGVKNLVFRNAYSATSGTIYIDDVIWEPIPSCLDVTGVVKGNSLSNSISLNWTKSASNETAWQYVYGASTVVDPNTLTPVDVSVPTATINGLTPSTTYKVWVRSKCHESSLGLWIGPLVMSTTCTPVSQFVENFDASTAFPSCWIGKVGASGTANIYTTPLTSPVPSMTNVLYMTGTNLAGQSVVGLPPVSNSAAGTYWLKLKVRGLAVGSLLEVGYLTNVNDPSSFVSKAVITTTSSSTPTVYEAFFSTFGNEPTTPYLAFRSGRIYDGTNYSYSTVYIDDVIWEPVPTCQDVSNIAAMNVTSTSIDFGWTASGSGETAWQYVYGPSTTVNPNTLTPVDITTNPMATINTGLAASTSYKIWVRSKCNATSLGSWIGPMNFATPCTAISQMEERFDTTTVGALPACWSKSGYGVTAAVKADANAPSAPNNLQLTCSGTTPVVVAMPALSNTGDGTHRLKFKFSGSSDNTALEVGYLFNISDPTSFSKIGQTLIATTAGVYYTKIIEMEINPDATQVLAFRNTGAISGGIVSIDDVIWQPIPTCADVAAVTLTGLTATTAAITWTPGASEKAWQYVIGNATVTNPNTLTPVDITTTPIATIVSLTPSTSYKVWVRSNCGGGQLGAWSDPVNFTTTCAGVTEFTENFDAITSLPSCWTKVGGAGTATITNSPAISPSPSLCMYTQYAATSLVIGLKPVSNAGAGTHRLKFKCISYLQGSKFDVGYLKNPADASSFELLTTITVNAVGFLGNDYQTVRIDDIGAKPDVNQVLAFRMLAGNTGAKIYIDEVVWEPLPSCADVNQINVPSSTSSGATITWSTYGTEAQWQVSVRPASETAPDAVSALSANAAKSLDVAGLSPSSTYKVWVRSACGAAYGDWIGPVLFDTQCITATALNENFSVLPNFPDLPVCWTAIVRHAYTGAFIQSETSQDIILFGNSQSGSGADIILVSPMLSNLSSGTLKFTALGGNNVEVGTLNNNDPDTAVFTKIQEIALKESPATNASIIFSTTTTDQYIGFRLKPTGTNQYVTIDNVTWDATATALANNQFDLSQFSYYPNPVKDVLNISYINNISGVAVYNILGQEVATKSVNENSTKIDMSSLTTGTYMVKVTSNNQVKTIKVVKE